MLSDGAGALVLEAREGTGTAEDQGILACDLNSDGRLDLYCAIGFVTGDTLTDT